MVWGGLQWFAVVCLIVIPGLGEKITRTVDVREVTVSVSVRQRMSP